MQSELRVSPYLAQDMCSDYFWPTLQSAATYVFVRVGVHQ